MDVEPLAWEGLEVGFGVRVFAMLRDGTEFGDDSVYSPGSSPLTQDDSSGWCHLLLQLLLV